MTTPKVMELNGIQGCFDRLGSPGREFNRDDRRVGLAGCSEGTAGMTKDQIEQALKVVKGSYRTKSSDALVETFHQLANLTVSAVALPEGQRLVRDVTSLQNDVKYQLQSKLKQEVKEMDVRHRAERGVLDAKLRDAKSLR